MNFLSRIWHTRGIEESDPNRQILFYAGGCSLPYLGFHYPEKGWVGCDSCWTYGAIQQWAYLDELLSAEQKLATAIEYLQKIAWLNITDDYWDADFKTHLYWCKSVADTVLKEIKGQ